MFASAPVIYQMGLGKYGVEERARSTEASLIPDHTLVASAPREIARQCYYYQKTVQDTLVDMRCSGLVQASPSGREIWYRLVSPLWKELLAGEEELPHWICLPPLFSAFEQIWLGISDPGLADSVTPLFLSSQLRELMQSVRGAIERSGLGDRLSDAGEYVGEEYIPVFFQDVRKLFD